MRNEGRSRSTKRNSLRGSDISFLQREMHGRVPFAPATISKPPKAALNSAGVSRNNLYLSNASADPTTTAEQQTQKRQSPGTADSGAGSTGNSRACRFSPPVLVDAAVYEDRYAAGNGSAQLHTRRHRE